MVNEVYGKKVGMTQIFSEDGIAIPVTAIEVKPLTVVGKKTADKEGYNAIVVSFGEIKEKNANKPLKGVFAKAGKTGNPISQSLCKFRVGIVQKNLKHGGSSQDNKSLRRGITVFQRGRCFTLLLF